MPQITMAKQVDKLEQDVAGQGGCTEVWQHFWGQLLSSGSWWLHNIKDSASTEVGSRSGHALYIRNINPEGESAHPKDSQKPMVYAQKGPEEWTGKAHYEEQET